MLQPMRCFVLCLLIVYHLETSAAAYTALVGPVDLTWPFDNNTLYWGKSQPFIFTRKVAEVKPDGTWYSVNDFCAGEHGGTHFDSPYHFYKTGWKTADVPLDRLIVNGITIDLREDTDTLHNETVLLPQHLEAWEEMNGPIPGNSVILVNFGWSKYYHNKEKYFGIDEDDNYNFPGISASAAQWIAKSGKVVGVGVDTPSIDPGMHTETHVTLASHQIYGMENVKIPPEFPSKGYLLYVMPMKIAEGTGAPLRLIAVPWGTAAQGHSLASQQTPWYGHVLVIMSSIVLFLFYTTNWMD